MSEGRVNKGECWRGEFKNLYCAHFFINVKIFVTAIMCPIQQNMVSKITNKIKK
jgi:hypothetical protein